MPKNRLHERFLTAAVPSTGIQRVAPITVHLPLTAPPVGAHFNRNIRDRYPYQEVEIEP